MLLVPECEELVDLCFIVDASGSITYNNPTGDHNNWELQLQFLNELVDLFEIGKDATRVGVVIFSEEVKLVFPLNAYSDAESVKRAISDMEQLKHETNTAEAYKVTREQCFNVANGDRPKVQNLAIMITDGRPEPDPHIRIPAALHEAELLKESGAIVLAVGVTNQVDQQFLEDVSSYSLQPSARMPSPRSFFADDFTSLGTIRRSFSEVTCNSIIGEKCFNTACI